MTDIDKEQLAQRMLEFIETQDGDYNTEWYGSPRDFAEIILSDLAVHLGFVLDVPPYVPIKTKPEIDRAKLLKELLPKVTQLLDTELNMRGYK